MTVEAETAVTCYKPRNTWSHQNLEEARKKPPLEPPEGTNPVNTLILDFQNRENKSCCFKPPSLCQSVTTALAD